MSYGKIENVCVSYNGKDDILKSLNLDIHEGELLALLGPSGCGKSTTLRAMAGLTPISKGRFMIEDCDMTHVPIHARDFGVVFQSYALFPHLTVFENVAFGLKMRGITKNEISARVQEMLEICNLEAYANRHPQNLSGGQRQRVALARALVIEPKLLLLDEPLSNLDAQLRYQMRNEIRRIQKQIGMTTVFVTHDQEECFAISDRVAIMREGLIEQVGTPESIYHHPATTYVARFVGFENIFPAIVFGGSQVDMWGCLRSEDVALNTHGKIKGHVISREYLGQDYRIMVQTEHGTMMARTQVPWEIGAVTWIEFKADAVKYVEETK